MRIDKDGNVGIGASPSTKLEVTDANGVGLRFGDVASTPSSQTAGYIGMSTSAYSSNNGDLVLIPRTSVASKILLMEGKVGIGTTGPDADLHVVSAGNAELEVERTSGSKINLQAQASLGVAGTDTNHDFGIKTNGSVRARVHNDGGMSIGTADKLDATCLLAFGTHTNDNVGIVSIRSQGDDESACALSIVKNSSSTSTSNILIKFGRDAYNSGAGMITVSGSTGAFGSFSDFRLKENIEDLPSQLGSIMALRPVSFDYKEEEYGQKDQIGFVAQEVEEVYPDLVGENEGYKITSGINKMEARLIKAIQEQQEQIEQLKTQIETLQ